MYTIAVGVALALFASGSPPPSPSSSQACDARVDGTAFPFLVPAHIAWDELWQRASDVEGTFAQRRAFETELGIQPSAAEQIALTAVGRRTFAAAHRGQAGTDARMADVEASLDARDRLLARVDAATAEKVQRWLRKTIAKSYRLGVTGKRVEGPGGKVLCKASINGNAYPHLIPEWDSWRNYFVFMRDASEQFRDHAGRYAPDYLTTLQRRRLGNSDIQVERLLHLLREAAERIEHYQLFATGLTNEARHDRVISTTMEMRARVRDDFPAATWIAVLREIDQIRRGTTFDFPPYEEGMNR